jgi:polyhydroxyalkanoate synthesis regulator phasin
VATGGSKRKSTKPAAARKRAPAKRQSRSSAKGAPDAVRRAVERTVHSTVGSAGLTRERAQEIVDEVVRRAEQSAARAGRGVRESVERAGQRRAEATAGVGDRLREAIPDIRVVTREDLTKLRREVTRLGNRVEKLEKELAKSGATRRRTKSPGASRSTRPKR